MTKTIIYIRTSTEEQEPELQIKSCMELSKKLGIEDFEVLEEKQSAWKDDFKREQFNNILSLIKKGNLKGLVVWDLDRIYRNRKKLVGFFELCKLYKCSIFSVRQTFLNEIQEIKLPEGFDFIKDMMINNFIQFLGWIAEDESKKKSDRVRNAIVNTDNGAFSYKGKKWGRKELSTETIRKVLELKDKNLSLREIAKQVFHYDKNNNKIPLSLSAVHKIISGKHRKNPLVKEGCS